MNAATIMVLLAIPLSPVVDDHFDHMELNHLFSQSATAESVLDQYIFWDGEHVAAWFLVERSRRKLEDLKTDAERLEYRATAAKFKAEWIEKQRQAFLRKWKGVRPVKQILHNWHPPKPPAYNPPFLGKLPQRVGRRWRLIIHTKDILRQITADTFRETWTQVDPEVVDRDVWETDKRRGFSNGE